MPAAFVSGTPVMQVALSDGSSNDPELQLLQQRSGERGCSIGVPTQQTNVPPIALLLDRLKSLKRVYLEVEEANHSLAELVQHVLQAYPQLEQELARFGWQQAGSPSRDSTDQPAQVQRTQGYWSQPLDVQGLAGCCKKFKYEKLQQIGSGSYGVVYKARDVETKELLAIKKLAAKYDDDCGLPDSTIREITALRELAHPNIVRLRDIITTLGSSSVYLVLDYLDCDLRHFLNTWECDNSSKMPIVKSFMWQLLQGVTHLHANSILHRDLKPQNILVQKATGKIKLTDFGLARAYLPPQKPYTEKVVTLYYRAPELLLGSPVYSKAVDMWSVGCIMAEMLNFKPLFQDNNEVGLIMKVFQVLGTPTEQQWPGISQLLADNFGAMHPSNQQGSIPFWPARALDEIIPILRGDTLALDLLTQMLTYDPERRISATAALSHPWFWNERTGAFGPPAVSNI